MKRYALIGLTVLLAACSANQTAGTPSAGETPSPVGGAPSTPSDTLRTQAVTPVALSVGQTLQITVYVSGQPAQPGQLKWTTSNAAVVKVGANGLLTGVGAGSASVRAMLVSNPAAYLDIPVTVKASTPAPAPSPTPAPAPAPAPAPSPTPAPAPSPTPSSYAQQVLTLTNQARAQARTCGSTSYPAAPALTWNAQLATAAQGHATDMATHNYFDHNSQDGRTPWQRIAAAGYSGSALAENIAAGQSTPQAVVAGWLQSPGHCANIMNARLKDLGVGYAQGGSYGSYWVQDFGAR